MTYDLEQFRDDMKALLVDNLAAKIAEIAVEKGESIITEIPEAAYFSDLNEKIINVENFIHYGFLPFDEGDSNANEIGQPVSMFFMAMLTDSDGGDVGENKILRYTRAMFEIFAEKATSFQSISILKIQVLPPELVNIQDTGWYRAGGVYVTGNLIL